MKTQDVRTSRQREIIFELSKGDIPYADIGKLYGISKSAVAGIVFRMKRRGMLDSRIQKSRM